MVGRIAFAVFHDHERDGDPQERLGNAVEGIWDKPAAGDRARRTLGDCRVQSLQLGRRRHEGALPGGSAAIAHQPDVPIGRSPGPGHGRVPEERDPGGARIRRWREPVAVAVSGIAGARDGGRRDRGGVRVGSDRQSAVSSFGSFMTYESVKVVDSAVAPGVRFTVAKMSFARRVELMRRVRELARRMEFLEGGESAGDKMDAGLLQAEIDRLYLTWGLRAVSGLEVDAAEETPEALAAVRAETGLNEAERKN